MKKILLITSIVLLSIAIVVYWFCSFWTGLLVTLILGALIAFDVFLLKNNSRLWSALFMLVISFSIMVSSFSALATRNFTNKLEDKANKEEIVEVVDDETEYKTEKDEENETLNEKADEEEQNEEIKEEAKVVTITEYVEVPVEKVVKKEIIKEVPVEKVVEKEVVKEVPVEKVVEVEKIVEVEKPQTNTQNNVNYGAYYGDPTSYNNNYNYGYNSGYYGDPTGMYNNYGNGYNTSISISGKKEVTAGSEYTYTISGVNSIKESKFKLPSNVSIESIRGNKVTLYFEEGWSGTYSIGYGNEAIKVKVYAD